MNMRGTLLDPMRVGRTEKQKWFVVRSHVHTFIACMLLFYLCNCTHCDFKFVHIIKIEEARCNGNGTIFNLDPWLE